MQGSTFVHSCYEVWCNRAYGQKVISHSSHNCDTRMTNAWGFQRLLLISSVSGACDARDWAVRICCPLTLPNQDEDFLPR